MIFDTFIYSGEKALLCARLYQLTPFVDYFVIIESEVTFTGRRRHVDLSFRNQILKQFGSKIRWIILDKLNGNSAWQREAFQRQSIFNGLFDIMKSDIILLSDVDEIPSESFFLRLKNIDSDGVLIAQMRLLRYCSHFESIDKWYGTIAIRYFEILPDLQSLRMRAVKYWLEDDSSIVENGGFHYTTFLSAKHYKEKIKSFSHTELDVFPFNNRLFLFSLLRLGISIDGGEILKLTKQKDSSRIYSFCYSKHRFNNLRERFAKSIQPQVQRLFNERVVNLSTPD